MKISTVSISTLQHSDVAIRVHTQNQISEFAKAIKLFGITRPMVVDEGGKVLVGNGLLEACKLAGVEQVPVYRLNGLSENDKRKLSLSDNKIYELGINDHKGIMQLVRELDNDFDIPGFDTELLQRLTAELGDITEKSIEEYGRIEDEEIKNITTRAIPTGSTDAPTQPVSTKNEVICPRCGFEFER